MIDPIRLFMWTGTILISLEMFFLYQREIENKKGNFYSYKKIDGQVLYDVLDRQLVRDFLRWSKKYLIHK